MSLHVIFGPMFSGKSTELKRLAENMLAVTHDSDNVVMINSSLDTRCTESYISTHTGSVMSCIKVYSLFDIFPCYKEHKEFTQYTGKHLYIDEAQFFPDLYEFIFIGLNYGIHFIVAGLDADFKQEPFGKILDIIPLADSVEKKTALCMVCGRQGIYKPAPFTIKKNIEEVPSSNVKDNVIDVGAQDKYMSVCRAHIHGIDQIEKL